MADKKTPVTPADFTEEQKAVALAFYARLQNVKGAARKANVPVSMLRIWLLDEADDEEKDEPAETEAPLRDWSLPFPSELPAEDDEDEEEAGERANPYLRPMPPEFMCSPMRKPERYIPAPEVERWFRAVFIDEDGPLYNPKLWHYRLAKVGFIWTNVAKLDKGNPVGGTAQQPLQSVKEKWAKGMAAQQLIEWFGCVPDFLIHLDSVYCGMCDDRLFCSLAFHEWSHCGYKVDADGEMIMNANPETDEEKPSWKMIKHHVEEFVDTVELFGVEACAGRSVDFVAVSHRRPVFSDDDIARACGRQSSDTGFYS